MYFRFHLGVHNIINLASPTRLDGLGTKGNIRVTFRMATEEDQALGAVPGVTVCLAESEVAPSRRALPSVEALWEYRIPPGFTVEDLTDEERKQYSATNQIKRNFPYRQMEPAFQDFIENARKDLVEAASRVMGLICWRLSLKAPQYWYRFGIMEWSRDGTEWTKAPVEYVVFMGHPEVLEPGSEAHVAELIRASTLEPLHHELFREAWRQKDSNPRSSVSIGVTALETAVKTLISNLIPKAEWLVTNLPSPPVFKIIGEYFPLLPVRQLPEHTVLLPGDELVKFIRNWTNARNDLMHGKGDRIEIDSQKLSEFLLVVNDMLYLCDYSGGVSWAIDHIRPETYEQLFCPVSPESDKTD